MPNDGRTTPPGVSRTPYSGSRRKLVLAFDVGTTYSGVSFCILDPGSKPMIKSVTQFPAHEATSSSCKIPTVIYYDQQGKVMAVGAEAMQDGIYETAEEENWYKAEWFKLHLRNKFGNSKNVPESIPPLPPGKTVVNVMADFLAYLLACTATYVQNTQPSGKDLWRDHHTATHSPNVATNDGFHFVLSHPNGWEGNEQSQIRVAAVLAGLIPDTTKGHDRISFVTEGEASLHFAVQNNLLSHIADSDGIVVVDAGGGTIDVSTYKCKVGSKIFEEIAVPRCYFHGSVFVTVAARNFLKGSHFNWLLLSSIVRGPSDDWIEEKLAESRYLDDLDHIASCFDKTTKIRFQDESGPQYIRFGGRSDNDPDVNIRFGQIKLEGKDVATFFRASIDCVIQAVMEQQSRSPDTIRHVVLVGGFAASTRLFHKVRDILSERGMSVIRPEDNVTKAVSDGAILSYVDHHVRTRVAKVTYGVPMLRVYQHSDPEHRKRSRNTFVDNEGEMVIRGGFTVLLSKGTQVEEDREFTTTVVHVDLDPIKTVASLIECYRGTITYPRFKDEDPKNFNTICTISADVSGIPAVALINAAGTTFYKVQYEVVMLFGLTEHKAWVRWTEKGVVKQSRAKLIYN